MSDGLNRSSQHVLFAPVAGTGAAFWRVFPIQMSRAAWCRAPRPQRRGRPCCARLGGSVERLLAPSPAVAMVRVLARRFSALVRDCCADALIPWLAELENSDLRGFAAGLREDEQDSCDPDTAPEQRPGRAEGYQSGAGRTPGLRLCRTQPAQGVSAPCGMITTCTEAAGEPNFPTGLQLPFSNRCYPVSSIAQSR